MVALRSLRPLGRAGGPWLGAKMAAKRKTTAGPQSAPNWPQFVMTRVEIRAAPSPTHMAKRTPYRILEQCRVLAFLTCHHENVRRTREYVYVRTLLYVRTDGRNCDTLFGYNVYKHNCCKRSWLDSDLEESLPTVSAPLRYPLHWLEIPSGVSRTP